MVKITGQMTLFEWMPTIQQEPDIGEYVTKTGAVICHIMRKGHIGKKVLYDCSTISHRRYQCGILEKYFECRGVMRSVIYTGKKQRTLLDHHPGTEIFECLPWDAYPERVQAIGRKGGTQ